VCKARIKICGITRPEDAEFASNVGADAIGIVFYGPSPRNVADLCLAREIALSVGPFVSVVGLFVDASVAAVANVLGSVPLNVLQFHGSETAAYCQQFERPYVKALRMKEGVNVLQSMEEYPLASGILLDTYKKGVPGGTGEAFNWERVPQNPSCPIILAGGLSPKNVQGAVKIAQPYGVDVSGGVESLPGVKDKNKIEAFIANARVEKLSESESKISRIILQFRIKKGTLVSTVGVLYLKRLCMPWMNSKKSIRARKTILTLSLSLIKI